MKWFFKHLKAVKFFVGHFTVLCFMNTVERSVEEIRAIRRERNKGRSKSFANFFITSVPEGKSVHDE